MTVVAAVEGTGGVWLAADSYASSESSAQQMHGKAYLRGCLGIGGAGSLRVVQLVRHKMRIPKAPPEGSSRDAVEKWAVGPLARCIKDVLDDERSDADIADRSFLIAMRGYLFTVQQDFSVLPTTRGYAAIGSGSAVAEGALYATRKSRDARARVILAVTAACEHTPSCRPPVEVVWVPAEVSQ